MLTMLRCPALSLIICMVLLRVLIRTSVMGAYIPTDVPSAAQVNAETEEAAMDGSGIDYFTYCYKDKMERTLSVQRIELFRQEILAKLNFDVEPDNLPGDLEVEEEVLVSYRAAQALNEATEMQEEGGGQLSGGCAEEKESFYAKEVKLFFPSHFHGETPPISIFDWGPLWYDKPVKRGADVKDGENLPPTHSDPDLSRFVSPIKYSLTFSDIDIPEDALLWSASLRLYKRKVVSDNNALKRNANPTENVEVYLVSSTIGVDEKLVTHSVLILSQDVRTEEDWYESFDVTYGMKKWLQDQNDRHLASQLHIKVVIRCPESTLTGLLFLPSIQFDVPSVGTKTANNALLVLKVSTPDTSNNRVRRELSHGISSEYCLNTPDEINCCLREWTINFRDDLGWNWVIAPKAVHMNYCQGLCPAIWPSRAVSTTLLNRLRQSNPTSSPEPCCLAHKVKPLTLLISNGGKLALSVLKDVIIDSCVCL